MTKEELLQELDGIVPKNPKSDWSIYQRKIVDMAIKALEQEPKWIPVEGRLPDIHSYSEKYLVTLKRGGIYIAMFTECDGKSWWTYDDVVAWMPLPESYKTETEVEDENISSM